MEEPAKDSKMSWWKKFGLWVTKPSREVQLLQTLESMFNTVSWECARTGNVVYAKCYVDNILVELQFTILNFRCILNYLCIDKTNVMSLLSSRALSKIENAAQHSILQKFVVKDNKVDVIESLIKKGEHHGRYFLF